MLTLYLRSRQVPRALPAAMVGVGVISLLGNDPDHPQRTLIFAVLALALGVGVLGHGLGDADAQLFRTAAIPQATWRAVHTLGLTVAVVIASVATTAAPVAIVLRDAAGLAGLTALAAALFGNQLAWTLPVAWAGAAAVVPALASPVALAALTWPMQPADSGVAILVATVLAAAGLLTYAVRGSRP